MSTMAAAQVTCAGVVAASAVVHAASCGDAATPRAVRLSARSPMLGSQCREMEGPGGKGGGGGLCVSVTSVTIWVITVGGVGKMCELGNHSVCIGYRM